MNDPQVMDQYTKDGEGAVRPGNGAGSVSHPRNEGGCVFIYFGPGDPFAGVLEKK